MSLDEIELTALRDLSEVEFLHVAQGIAQNSDMMLCHSDLMGEAFDALIDHDGESFLVSRNLSAGAVFKYAIVISSINNQPHCEFVKVRFDPRMAAANDK
jgi:hypothetical protein